jgi:hypothetical protein
MSPEQNLEQQNISPEQVTPVDQSVETSLDATKIEQVPQAQAPEKLDDDQIVAQVALPDDQAPVVPMTSEVIHTEVDNILSNDMDNVFLSLDAGTQRAFKLKGEETTNKITALLMGTKVKVSEITKLILEWLRIIPKANKHYLEQQAKIKTGEIIKIKNE